MIDKPKALARAAKHELKVYGLVIRDPRTPVRARLLLGLAFIYIISPIDLIPDFIPVVGQLDDLIIVPCLILLAMKMTPKEVIEDCRLRVSTA